MTTWQIYNGTNVQDKNRIYELPTPPSWRQFDNAQDKETYPVYIPDPENLDSRERGRRFIPKPEEVKIVNAAICLRRPLLVTGNPGSGKSSLAYAIAHELALGKVLHWPITSRSNLQEGLFRYDAIGRIHEASHSGGDPSIGKFIQLGPLGTAFLPWDRPRVLLIDEIDKSDLDLPNDLLHIFETGEFEIPELARLPEGQEKVDVMAVGESGRLFSIHKGRVQCRVFPLVVMTSNAERSFPPAFLRRCIRLDIKKSNEKELAAIVNAHFGLDDDARGVRENLIADFIKRRDDNNESALATDQLLNALYLITGGVDLDKEGLLAHVLRSLEA